MVAGRASGIGLSPTDLERIRQTLAAGRKPKVVFTSSAGQIAGQVGQVVGLTDPSRSEEWLTVRFGRDELPFAPTDLSLAVRAVPHRRADGTPAVSEKESSMSPSPASAKPAASAVGKARGPAEPSRAGKASVPAAQPSAAAAPPAAPVPPTQPVGQREPRAVERPAPAREPEPAGEPATARRSPDGRPGRKPGKAKPSPALTVTLGYADGEWTVHAAQGAKVLARPCLVRPAEALRMVSLLDVPAVQQAVEQIVDAAREEAEQRAEQLRAELAEVEARLADLRDQG